jgi:hypothetical protein
VAHLTVVADAKKIVHLCVPINALHALVHVMVAVVGAHLVVVVVVMIVPKLAMQLAMI